MAIGKLTHLKVLPGHRLRLRWDDGVSGVCDLTPIIAARKNLSALHDAIAFNVARLSDDGWSVEWPSGIDFGAPQLRGWLETSHAPLAA